MNQKKAKALRRECLGMAKMTQRVLTDSPVKVYVNKKTGAVKRVQCNPLDYYTYPVSHYRNAKKHYRGSVPAAIRAAMRHAETMEAIGVYAFK